MGSVKSAHNVLGDLLGELGVPHTARYTEKRFGEMPFPTWFGLKKLLQEYGVSSEAWRLTDKGEMDKLTPPFIAATAAGEVVVTDVNDGQVEYLTEGVTEMVPREEFENAWNGNVFLAFPDGDASEPAYVRHARLDFLMRAKKWVLAACAVFLLVYLFIANGLWMSVPNYLIAGIDIAGLYFTYLLVQKSLKIHNPAADRVCGVLQAGGCDSILEMKASKFFGLFGWSEVGFAYFSVSLVTMLLLPDMLPWLALCNLCCLPFTAWSIWYQRFRAHKWCTLCVCVQASLWLLFFSYLWGGWLRRAWPLSMNFVALGASYLGVMLALNALMPLIEKDASTEGGDDEKD